MTWKILQGTDQDLRVQLYGRISGGNLDRELLLVGRGETFSEQSSSRLFVKTRFTEGFFVSVGRVLRAFGHTQSESGVYDLDELTVSGELTPGAHRLLRLRFVPTGAVHWLYDEALITPLPVDASARFYAADAGIHAISLEHHRNTRQRKARNT